MKKAIWTCAAAIILMFSCEKHEPSPTAYQPSLLDSTFFITKELYYWNGSVPSKEDFGINRYANPEEILLGFRQFSPKNKTTGISIDKWSFAMKLSEWNELLNGTSNDFGCGFRFLADTDLRISWVQPNAESAKIKLKRGDRVLALNGVTASTQNINLLTQILQKETSVILDVQTSNGNRKNLKLGRSPYIIEPILNKQVFLVNGKKVGYLHLFTFISSLDAELDSVIRDFATAGVSELILDLRYNGGGLTKVMENLCNHLVPGSAYGKVMYKIVHNQDYSSFDSNVVFEKPAATLSLNRITFITTNSTASASEILISSLKPYLEARIIGTETQGKLYGMYTVPYKDYILAPVAFKTFNSRNESLEGNGFIPDLVSADDVSADFGENEACIRHALYDSEKNGKSIKQKKVNEYKSGIDLKYKVDIPLAVNNSNITK